MTFKKFHRSFGLWLHDLYGVTPSDVGVENDYLLAVYKDGDTPEQTARHFGQKYDLNELTWNQ